LSDAKRIRAEVKNRIKAVQAKIRRTERNTGARVGGSEFDPRRRAGIENNYNAKQLSNYLVQLNDFMRRGNQFVGGHRGAPLPRGQVSYLMSQQEQIKQLKIARDNAMSQIQSPTGMTVTQQTAMTPRMGGHSDYGVYPDMGVEAKDIASAGALKKLTRQMINILKGDRVEKVLNEGRDNLIKALEYMGENEFVDAVEDLSDYQFDALWFGTNMAESTFLKYEQMKERAAGTRKEAWQDKVVDTAYAENKKVLDWAKDEVPRERP
jgi:hypothetical protein